MSRSRVVIGALAILILGCLLLRHSSFESQIPHDFWDDVEQSGESFPLNGLAVIANYGYSDGGDRLRYMVIRAYPLNSTSEERRADPRYENNGGLPLIRHADGEMRPVETDGRVYLFIGDELRTMRVKMNEHADTDGIARAGTLDGIWNYLQRFRVADADSK